AALAETGHHRAGRPVVAQARYRADQRVAVGGKGEGTVDHPLDATAFQDGEAAVGEGDRVLDLVELFVQKLMPEIPRRAVHRPGLAGFLVEADAKAAALLAQIA